MNDEIMKAFENNKLGPDDSFRFHCTQCGACCINREDILLNAKDLFFISKKLARTPLQMIERYCELYIGSDSRLPVIRLLPRGTDRHCPLLKGRRCSVHDVKPTICGLFPLGRATVHEKEALDDPNIPDEWHTEYFFTNPGCGDDKRSYTVREWLSSFDIPLEDEFFMEWQQTIIHLSNVCRNLDELVRPELMQHLWNQIVVPMYLDYDISKEFMPQFKVNAAKLKALCEAFSKLITNHKLANADK